MRGVSWVSFHHRLTSNYLFAVINWEVKQESRSDLSLSIFTSDTDCRCAVIVAVELLFWASLSRRCFLRHAKENENTFPFFLFFGFGAHTKKLWALSGLKHVNHLIICNIIWWFHVAYALWTWPPFAVSPHWQCDYLVLPLFWLLHGISVSHCVHTDLQDRKCVSPEWAECVEFGREQYCQSGKPAGPGLFDWAQPTAQSHLCDGEWPLSQLATT